jgi:hypothetical protein
MVTSSWTMMKAKLQASRTASEDAADELPRAGSAADSEADSEADFEADLEAESETDSEAELEAGSAAEFTDFISIPGSAWHMPEHTIERLRRHEQPPVHARCSCMLA